MTSIDGRAVLTGGAALPIAARAAATLPTRTPKGPDDEAYWRPALFTSPADIDALIGAPRNIVPRMAI